MCVAHFGKQAWATPIIATNLACFFVGTAHASTSDMHSRSLSFLHVALGFSLALAGCGGGGGGTIGEGGGGGGDPGSGGGSVTTGTAGAPGSGGSGGSGTGGGEPVECTDPLPGCVLKSDKLRELNPAVSDADREALRAGNVAFALDLHRAVTSTSTNVITSPYSVTSALGMTFAGAREATETAMASTLHFTLPQDKLHPALNAVDLALASRAETGTTEGGKGFRLRTANSLWVKPNYLVEPTFLDVMAESYGASARLVDFNKKEEAVEIINSWVENKTDGLIKDLLAPGMISPDTVLTLVNAISFKAAWASPFDKEATKPGTFHRADGTQAEVAMMHRFKGAMHVATDELEAVAIGYDRVPLSMLVVLPKAGEIDTFEQALDAAKLDSIVKSMDWRDVELTVPKFRFEFGAALRPVLEKLGMSVAFDLAKADFTGINSNDRPYIQDVIHKAFIGIDEAGTEAAAATAVTLGASGSGVEPEKVTMTVDRPFLFFVIDEPTGTILFSGRVNDPK